MVEFVCPHCKNQLQISDEHLGKTGRCNHCGGEITIQSPTQPPYIPTTSEQKKLFARTTPGRVLSGGIAAILVFTGLAGSYGAIDFRHKEIPTLAEWAEAYEKMDIYSSANFSRQDDEQTRNAYVEERIAIWNSIRGSESTFSITGVMFFEKRRDSLSRLLGSLIISIPIFMSGLTIFARLAVLLVFPEVTGRALYVCCIFSHALFLSGVSIYIYWVMFPSMNDGPPSNILPLLITTFLLQIIPTAIVGFYHREY